jgi:hypothetical protein
MTDLTPTPERVIEDYLSHISGATLAWCFFGALALLGLVIFAVRAIREEKAVAGMAPEEREAYQVARQARQEAARLEFLYGALNPMLICPHRQTKGSVRTKSSNSGVTASRKPNLTQAHCGACTSSWAF